MGGARSSILTFLVVRRGRSNSSQPMDGSSDVRDLPLQIYLKVTQAWRDMKELRGGCLQECFWIEVDYSRGDTAKRPAG